LTVEPILLNFRPIQTIFLAFVAITLVACSNYVINEVLDTPFDRLHPIKCNGPAARGLVHFGIAYTQWLLMIIAGIGIGLLISRLFMLTLIVLWVMGRVSNFPPLRTKDVPYLDVIIESINYPLRMLLGWFAVTSALVSPISLLVACWMIGSYFIAINRFSELSEMTYRGTAGAYRALFKWYTSESLLVSVFFCASTAMLFLSFLVIRYRIELILGFSLIALTMALYLKRAFRSGSAERNREKSYHEPLLMASFTTTASMLCLLLLVRLALLERGFVPRLLQLHVPAAFGQLRLLEQSLCSYMLKISHEGTTASIL
jgi:4-hydroxybenzoate polyprenyltransferase